MERKTSDRLIKIVVAVGVLFWAWEGGRSYGVSTIKDTASYLIGSQIVQQYAMRCNTNPQTPKKEIMDCVKATEERLLEQYKISRD